MVFIVTDFRGVVLTVGVLDLGSNSFILLVQEGEQTVLEEVYEVGLRSVEDEEEAFKLAGRVISHIKTKFPDLPLHAFGTAVFRERPALFERILRTFDLNGQILSEEDEAYFTYMSVDPNFEKSITVFDLGGGSLEIVRKDWFVSLALGTHVLNRLFDLSLPDAPQFYEAVKHVESKLPDFEKPVGIGGSFVAIAAVKNGAWDLKTLDGIVLNQADVEFVFERLKGNTLEQVRDWKVIPIGRERTIMAGCAVALAITKREPVIVSTKGFRHTLARMLERGRIERPWRARGDLNSRPPDPQSGALSS